MHHLPVALGTANFGTLIPVSQSFSLLDKYTSMGGRIIDTANNYACWRPNGGGASELTIGCWFENKIRSEYTIMTKIGSMPISPGNSPLRVEGLSSQAVVAAVEQSLSRLKTSYIDILLAHHDDANTPLRETWETFTELVKTGKVRKIGISNYSSERVIELAEIIKTYGLHPLDVVQMKYSAIEPLNHDIVDKLVLLNNTMKHTLKNVAPDAMIYGYSALLKGLFEKDTTGEWPSAYDSSHNRNAVKDIQNEALEPEVSPSALVLKTIVDQGIIPVIATSKPNRLESNLKLLI